MANYYKGSFVNTQVDYSDNSPNEQTIYVKITDVTEDDGSEVALELADAPVTLQTVDNSEDKFTTIKSKSCTLRVFTSNNVNAMTFANGGDNQYKVEIAINSESDIIYTGWLSISDLGQTFQPDPNVLVLTASDGIAFLRDVPLSDEDDRYLSGPHSLIDYISWCLQKTGLDLDIWVQMNLLEENAIYDYPEYHFYNYVYLDAQTFEKEVGILEDCYSVLEKILGEFCEISQQKNVWFIKSIDEAGYENMRICQFDYEGTPLAYQTVNYLKEIGPTETMAFMNDDARLSLQRPYKSVIHTYDYQYPIELVQNIDFEKGTATTEPDPTQPTSTGIYKPEGWVLARATDGTGGIWFDAYPQAGARGEIIKEFEYGYEKDRYLVVEHEDVVGTDYIHYVKGSQFYVQKGDLLKISVDVGQDTTLTSVNPVHVWLNPDQGNYYYTWQLDTTSLNSEGQPVTNQWVSKNKPLTAAIADNPFAQMWRMNLQTVSAGDEIPKYKTISGEIEVPETGRITIRLCTNLNIFAPYYFSNLNIQIVPRVNGSYQKYTGQEHKSEQAVDNKASRDNTVFMTDAPRIEMKGAMTRRLLGDILYSGNAAFETGNGVTLDGFQTPLFNLNDYVRVRNTTSNNGTYRIVGINYSFVTDKTVLEFAESTTSEIDASTILDEYIYQLTDAFYDSIEWPGGGAPTEDIYPYGQHQNQAVWNQFNRVFSAFEATIDGLDTDTVDSLNLPNLPDLLHCYQQTDSHPATDYKQFKVLHYEQDTDNCEWSLYMIEVTDSNYPKTYIGHSFKYVQK